MKPGKADLVRMSLFLLFLLATVPAYCQRGTLDLNVGETSDKFGALAPVTGTALDLNGELTVIKPSQKNGGPSIVAGGEVRVPTDTSNHAKEVAVYGGLAWGAHNFSIGVNAEVRKIYMPVATVDGQVLNRDNLELFELPLVIKYKFGPGRHAFFEVQGEPEFSPHYKTSPLSRVILPFPTLDHGYDLRGSVGYTFGKWWYVKGTYDSRYFKFDAGQGNPTSLYNWKSNLITGGVGVRF
jgi:hypothetical protein